MGYIYSGIVSLAVAMLSFALKSVVKENTRLKREKEREASERERALEDGVVCLLRKELIQDYEKWTDKGYITSTALANGLLMYDAYKALGGNGMVDHMKEEIEELHIENH